VCRFLFVVALANGPSPIRDTLSKIYVPRSAKCALALLDTKTQAARINFNWMHSTNPSIIDVRLALTGRMRACTVRRAPCDGAAGLIESPRDDGGVPCQFSLLFSAVCSPGRDSLTTAVAALSRRKIPIAWSASRGMRAPAISTSAIPTSRFIRVTGCRQSERMAL
jgi:hypothetical protein